MHKVAPLFTLLGTSALVLAGHFATIPTAAASPAFATAPAAAAVEADPTPPDLDVPGLPVLPSVVHVAPAKRKLAAPTKNRLYQCQIRPLQMGTVDTNVRVCEWKDGVFSSPER